MKKILKWVGIGFAALLVVAVVGAWAMFGTFVKAANSIEKLEDGLYSIRDCPCSAVLAVLSCTFGMITAGTALSCTPCLQVHCWQRELPAESF